MSLHIGQRIQVDFFGMRVPGLWNAEARGEGTVVGLGPGVITVRVEGEDGRLSEVTVSPGRIER